MNLQDIKTPEEAEKALSDIAQSKARLDALENALLLKLDARSNPWRVKAIKSVIDGLMGLRIIHRVPYTVQCEEGACFSRDIITFSCEKRSNITKAVKKAFQEDEESLREQIVYPDTGTYMLYVEFKPTDKTCEP